MSTHSEALKTNVIDLTDETITVTPDENEHRDDQMDREIIDKVQEVFPDASENFVRRLYTDIKSEVDGIENNSVIETLISRMLIIDYPKKDSASNREEELSFLEGLLPDADPSYLRKNTENMDENELKQFAAEALEKKNYPKKKAEKDARHKTPKIEQYILRFSVDEFMSQNPAIETLQDDSRVIKTNEEDDYFTRHFLYNLFPRIHARTIQSSMLSSRGNMRRIVSKLRTSKANLRSPRQETDLLRHTCENIPLLQQLAFLQHESEILQYIQDEKIREEKKRKEAKENGLMLTCCCCFDGEIMPTDSYYCENDCIFCKSCVVKSVEISFSEGKTEFACIGGCGSTLSLRMLQDALPPNLFSKVAQKNAVAEIKSAGIENLEMCPFCDFATIIGISPEINKVFICLNPECLKESCRLCRKLSHVPLRCEEVEQEEDVQKRTYIENKMTEALLRVCWKCGMRFFKEEGCNKMTCSCGATMCYLCQKPVTDYSHFNGIGGDRFNLCPLYSDNLGVNKQNIAEAGEKAKIEMGIVSGASTSLKIDPTKGVDEYFKERAKTLKPEPHMEQIREINQGRVVLRRLDVNDYARRRLVEMRLVREILQTIYVEMRAIHDEIIGEK